jgi:hypothetical protein
MTPEEQASFLEAKSAPCPQERDDRSVLRIDFFEEAGFAVVVPDHAVEGLHVIRQV